MPARVSSSTPGGEGHWIWYTEITKRQSHLISTTSVSPPPAAKQSAHHRWACTLMAWYVGDSGGLGWFPGKTSGRSASSATLPSAPPTRWDRKWPCPPPSTITAAWGVERGRGWHYCCRPHPHGPPPLPRLLVSLLRKLILHWKSQLLFFNLIS